MSEYKIQCTVTGLWSVINTRWKDLIIKKHGSVDAFRKLYVCRDAKRMLKEGKTEDEVRQAVADGTLASKAKAPKAKKVKATKKTPVAEVAEEPEVLDPDIEAFMKAA